MQVKLLVICLQQEASHRISATGGFSNKEDTIFILTCMDLFIL